MNLRKTLVCVLCVAALIGVFGGCGHSDGSWKDGYYTAEMADYSDGWKEFVTVHVEDNTVVSVEYNAKNVSGYLKSWDMAYMRKMSAAKGTYPNHYTRRYAHQVVEKQSGDNIDTVAGASLSGANFRLMVAAALDMARLGTHAVAVVQS